MLSDEEKNEALMILEEAYERAKIHMTDILNNPKEDNCAPFFSIAMVEADTKSNYIGRDFFAGTFSSQVEGASFQEMMSYRLNLAIQNDMVNDTNSRMGMPTEDVKKH